MAVANNVDICNMALDHLGKPSITDISEGSVEAQACLRQYDIARRMVLVRSPWTFARRLRSLSQLSANGLSDTWAYHYDLPNEMLKLHRLVEAGRAAMTNEPPAPMYIEGGTVYTNLESAHALYTYDSTDTLSWSPLFDDALALFLAMRLSPSMTRRKSDADALQRMYREALAEAIETDAQQESATYVYGVGGYTDARDAGAVPIGREADGSTIWE